MPIIDASYRPSLLFRNTHIATIYPNFFRKVVGIVQKRERLVLPDDDFMELDWSVTEQHPTIKVAILLHGLEGNAQRGYMLGLTRQLLNVGWDVVGVNLRNCGGTPNQRYTSYHAGITEDLAAVVAHVQKCDRYTTIGLFGFSLGGNVVLKYLGKPRDRPNSIQIGVAISTPCDLYDSLCALQNAQNKIYVRRFLRQLKGKLYEKQKAFPERLHRSDIAACRSLLDIDDLYTSKAHGFADAMEYYSACSSAQFLPQIKTPTLVLNAANDSFLGPKCYPVTAAKANPYLSLEIPKYGGHVGFYLPGTVYYHEQRILKFLAENGL